MNGMDIGNKLIKLREEKGYSQKDFAQLIPVSQPTLSRWENGSIIPTIHQLERICEVMGIPMESLWGEDKAEYDSLRKKVFRLRRTVVILFMIIVVGVILLTVPKYKIVEISDVHESDYGNAITVYVSPIFFITESGADSYGKKIVKKYENNDELMIIEVKFVKNFRGSDADENEYFTNVYFLRKFNS